MDRHVFISLFIHLQLVHLNALKEDCNIRRIEKNSAKCRDLPLRRSGSGDLGKVVLHYYLFKIENSPYFTTGLNSTFHNIKWTRLRLQYKDRSNETFNFCREFNLNPRIHMPLDASLFYDCLWSVEHEDKEFDFKYEAFDARKKTSAGRHYILKVPRHYNLLPHKPLNITPVFMYMDISELPLMVLYWETLRDVTEFHVTVYQDGKVAESKKVSDPPNEFGQFAYSYDVGFSTSEIQFSVEILDKRCIGRCEVFKSPVINIEKSVSNRPLLIGIVGSIVLLPVFLYSLYVWKRYSLLAVDTLPTVLLVYTRSLRSHTQAVLALTKYLRKYCHINALVDELDIPLTKSKDPHIWYQEAFSQADVVLVISSPPRTDCLEEGLYQKVDLLALRILSNKLCDPQCKQKLLSLVLPYCSSDDIPVEAKNVRCYSFKKDWNELLWNMRCGMKSFWIPKIDYLCYQSQVPGGDSDLRRYGKFLLDALQIAEDDVQKRNFSIHKSIDDGNFEEVPLQMVGQFTDTSDINDLMQSLKDDRPDPETDAQEVYSVFPGDLQTMDLLDREHELQFSNEHTAKSQSHQIDLNSLVL
ncbi:Uncharacterized protein GBIM_15091 [Gryllus bimaculatus]|nr:Uncharacterized protein GBIM_15091 [Gryllus bimaculatus]